QDMKRIEETEDCFILDFDPFDSFDFKKLSVSSGGDKDLDIIHETGQVACRDYPHPRHLCLTFPFGSTPNATHCHLLSVSSGGDKDLDIIHETGQVACRDYPHPRHLCLTFPFGSTPNATHCHLCYCCVCDKPAPRAQWMSHCNTSADSMGRKLPTPESQSFYYSD
ncbi:hypothetical protein F2Q68_00001064, partial [Brassica cretica]